MRSDNAPCTRVPCRWQGLLRSASHRRGAGAQVPPRVPVSKRRYFQTRASYIVFFLLRCRRRGEGRFLSPLRFRSPCGFCPARRPFPLCRRRPTRCRRLLRRDARGRRRMPHRRLRNAPFPYRSPTRPSGFLCSESPHNRHRCRGGSGSSRLPRDATRRPGCGHSAPRG